MKKILALVMVLGVIGGVLAGCGAKAEDASAAPATPAATAGEAAK
ncbi:MAG: hypothetical protein WCK51_02595 [Armatimonadota bacterium]